LNQLNFIQNSIGATNFTTNLSFLDEHKEKKIWQIALGFVQYKLSKNQVWFEIPHHQAYPDLKASDNFKQLQNELADTETKVASSRQFYNANVLDLNTKIQTVPSNIVAGMFGFKPAEFFEAEAADKKPVEVKF